MVRRLHPPYEEIHEHPASRNTSLEPIRDVLIQISTLMENSFLPQRSLFFALPFSFDILAMCSLVALNIFELSLFVSNGVKLFPSCAAMGSSFLRHF